MLNLYYSCKCYGIENSVKNNHKIRKIVAITNQNSKLQNVKVPEFNRRGSKMNHQEGKIKSV